MIFGGEEQDIEQRRTTLGLAFLVLGLVLLMWAYGSWIYRNSTRAQPIAADHQAGDEVDVAAKAVRIAPGLLLGGALLFVVFLAATFVFVRSSRRYRQSLSRRSSPPSDTTDVWSMHKLKDFDDSGG
jgi:heme/copper-type cytochrome/quinol oxidase subunit 2